MKIRATFKGKDGSLDYKHGIEYVLIVHGTYITRIDGSGVCPYTSVYSFLNNWANIIEL